MKIIIDEIKKQSADCQLNYSDAENLLKNISKPNDENYLVLQYLIGGMVNIMGLSSFLALMSIAFEKLEDEFRKNIQ